jgi:hypothetical protein
MDNRFNAIDDLHIEALSDELLESVAGAGSTGPQCCSDSGCSNKDAPELPVDG